MRKCKTALIGTAFIGGAVMAAYTFWKMNYLENRIEEVEMFSFGHLDRIRETRENASQRLSCLEKKFVESKKGIVDFIDKEITRRQAEKEERKD